MQNKFFKKVLIFAIIIGIILFSKIDLINNTFANEIIIQIPKESIMNLTYEDSSNGLPTIGQWRYATRIGDVNNDGYLDIIRLRGHDDYNTEDQGFQIWLGDGTGSWTKTYIPNGNFGYGGTAIGDFNNDGYLDAAYGVHHNRNHPLIGAWTGDGGTSFIEKSTGLATDGETWGMAPCDFGDFNNDGFLDLAVGSMGGNNGIRAYENHDGGNSWSSKSNGLPHNSVNPNVGNFIQWADINKDGYLDIIISTQITSTGEEHFIWLGDGQGNWVANDFGLPVEYGFGSYGLDLGDVNNDGWLDITFIKNNGPVVYLFNGTSWIEASSGLPLGGYYCPLAFGDLNNDGFLDLVGLSGFTTGTYPYYLDWTKVHAWLGDGTGNWTEIDEIATDIPGWPESVILADIDHNNFLDIIFSSDRDDYEPGGLRCYKNTETSNQLDIIFREPISGEVYIYGGVRKIRWTSEVPTGPATITLQYSITGNSGPWYTIAENITDSNYYQWIIPNFSTGSGFIKATVYCNDQNVSTVNTRPFIIYNGDNFPPYTPSNPNPVNGAINVDNNTTLSWTCSDPEGDLLTYDVYLEKNDPTPDILVSDDQIETSYKPETLSNGTIYYWQIIAKDSNGGINGGPLWSFTTKGEPGIPPNPPIIDGPLRGKVGQIYTYKFSSIDPENEDVYYFIDWGDQTNNSWLGPFASGEIVNVSHKWDKKDNYEIKAKAKDNNGYESNWSILKIKIPRFKTYINSLSLLSFEKFVNRFPYIFQFLRRLQMQS